VRRETLQDLVRLQRAKQFGPPRDLSLGQDMLSFFKQSVGQRQTKLAKIAQCWATLVPQSLTDHCALHGLSRGTLTVLVDSASHLYEIKQLLLAGLEDQLLMACKTSGLRKVTLRPGRPDERPAPRK
jgi:hypothetical protein